MKINTHEKQWYTREDNPIFICINARLYACAHPGTQTYLHFQYNPLSPHADNCVAREKNATLPSSVLNSNCRTAATPQGEYVMFCFSSSACASVSLTWWFIWIHNLFHVSQWARQWRMQPLCPEWKTYLHLHQGCEVAAAAASNYYTVYTVYIYVPLSAYNSSASISHTVSYCFPFILALNSFSCALVPPPIPLFSPPPPPQPPRPRSFFLPSSTLLLDLCLSLHASPWHLPPPRLSASFCVTSEPPQC